MDTPNVDTHPLEDYWTPERLAQRDRLADVIVDAIHADESRTWDGVAARLIAADVRVAGETYAAHPFKIGGYLTEEAPDNECVWRVDAFSPYCGITRADHDDVLDRRRTGAQNAEHDAILSAASELAVRVGPDEGLRAAVQKAIDEHLGRMASSEPFTAAQYRRHGIDALGILRAALEGSAE